MRKIISILIASLGLAGSAFAAPPIDTTAVPCDKPGGGNNKVARSSSPCNFGSGSVVPPEIPAEQAPGTSTTPTKPEPATPELKGLPGIPGTDAAEPVN